MFYQQIKQTSPGLENFRVTTRKLLWLTKITPNRIPVMKKRSFSPSIAQSVIVLRRDRYFKPLIKKHGPPQASRSAPTTRGVFQALIRSIIYQQISGKAAYSIHTRFLALFPRKNPTPEAVYKLSDAQLRSAGLSAQKVAYIRDLAQKFSDGTIEARRLPDMTTVEAVEHLTQIKGVGVWTVHMLLIFTLNRADVLPTGDLGIQKGFQIVYGLKKLPNHKQMERFATPWREHASAASWYLWRAADAAKGKKIKRGG
jgi:DNA-3-methyladenine glycosylase II